jgi:predicted nuclease of predicted toxin-antitoxin system
LKIKLDENLGEHLLRAFQSAGHDTATVSSQKVCGATDLDIIHLCQQEKRALITLDLDFGNPFRFKPSEHFGIAVLRPSKPLSQARIEEACQTLLNALQREDLSGNLWIVEPGRIRIYQQPEL